MKCILKKIKLASVLVLFLLLLVKCNLKPSSLNGFWSLANSNVSIKNNDYLEYQIDGNNVRAIIDCNDFINTSLVLKDDSIIINKFRGRYELVNQDSLVVFKENQRYEFLKLASQKKISNIQDVFDDCIIRQFRYQASNIPPYDTVLINRIKHSMFFYFQGNYLKSSIEENIIIEPNK